VVCYLWLDVRGLCQARHISCSLAKRDLVFLIRSIRIESCDQFLEQSLRLTCVAIQIQIEPDAMQVRMLKRNDPAHPPEWRLGDGKPGRLRADWLRATRHQPQPGRGRVPRPSTE